MGKEFLNLMDPDEVKKIIDSLNMERKIERINLSDAYQRVLAEDVHALIDLPPFNRASMDGYAVQAQDTFGASEDNPIILNLIEKIRAGDSPSKEVQKGTCSEVGTGAPLPAGADAVVMVEVTDIQNDKVEIMEAVAPGTNRALQGSDIEKGQLLMEKGTLLTAAKIGALSAVGLKEIPVFAKPIVAVISTGNELIKPEEELKHGKLYDINSESISNAVKSCGCTPLASTIVKDDYDSIKNRIDSYKDADVIITSGGTSAGAGDILRQVVEDMGKILVHGISVKPGKPTLIGTLPDEGGNVVLFGLPGYPVSALMIFHGFVAPFLRGIAGVNEFMEKKESRSLKLGRRYHSARGRSHFVLVKIEGNIAHPILKDSGAITALAEADGYFEVPKNVEIMEKGEQVKVQSLSGL
ncbi:MULTISPECIES: gephyrin-like molybdotransferase Glp [Methanobacterium]|uniref:Molybdenum cofactor synthesis domain-containing protein n=1 Tax=Methanobacterium formicicum TaxID=2162 RepID=A0A089ZHE0_METFO|nr:MULTISPECIES: gephyrin-like molybdotransferase Glp [Methanobacterium]AIS32740.1 molybdopterin biosynthesis protein MoeA1 [Methanobacterium formicicum]KUK75336.1 MAG: Molybdenum cofactor synthesis domain-containing protein [Methanobacterium sp. 42_16]MBF4476201.1 molybdopterin molybdenumtransferase MoeA [Methanobacterium formicicum]MDD4810636.1 molybdopterin-binding protein [Methanobacterium formicicum]MDG3546648.1 molybdopterin-binding protein [Methanobacterium formicicum]